MGFFWSVIICVEYDYFTSVQMDQWDSPNTLCDTKMILQVSLNIGKLVAVWLSPNILTWYKICLKN